MSTATKKGAPLPPSSSSTGKKHSPHRNGSGPPLINYSNEPQDDENMNEIVEQNVELDVILPDGTTRNHTVDPNVPMIDLLVNLAAGNKLNPSGFSLKLFSSETGKNIDYKANQTIGSLPGRTLQLVSKRSSQIDKARPNTGKNVKPFEMTNRFSVNLPQNQKRVLRISYNTLVSDLFVQVCGEKNFDPSRYMFQLPGKPLDHVNMRGTISDLKTAEINLVSVAMVEQTQSMPDLTRTSSMKDANNVEPPKTKKKGGVFSFLRRDKKNKQQEIPVIHAKPQDLSLPPPQGQSTPPSRRSSKTNDYRQSDTTDGATASRKEHVPPVMKQIGRKRQAPLPPQKRPAPVKEGEVSAASSSDSHLRLEKRTEESAPAKLNIEPVNQKLHSRNSSDSSGYHELTLSGAESPEAYNAVNGAFKTSIDADSIDSGENQNGDSGVRDLSPDRTKGAANDIQIGMSQTLPHKPKESKGQPKKSNSMEDVSLEKVIVSNKRKKARAPPPPGGSKSVSKSTSLPHEHTTTSQPDVISSTETVVHAEVNSSVPEFDSTDSYDRLEDSAVSGLDEILDEQMMMLDDCSVHTEDLSDIPRSQRPCAFVPPPPPSEPPPSDTEPADYQPKVDTKDVAVGIHEDSPSLKNSPVDNHHYYRADSRLSIDTIEDVSREFALTIAVGEEAYSVNKDIDLYDADVGHVYKDLEYLDDEDGDYHKEMAMFAEKMSKMKFAGDTEALRLPLDFYDKPRSESETSFISKQASSINTTPRDRKTSESDSSSIKESPRSKSLLRDERQGSGKKVLVDEVDKKRYSAEIEAADISYALNIEETKPASEDEEQKEEKTNKYPEEEEEDEDEEEYTETTEEIVYPIQTFEKVVEVDSNVNDVAPVVRSRFDSESPKYDHDAGDSKPKEKEEFVITASDLQMVNFSVPKREKKTETAMRHSSYEPSSNYNKRLIQLSPPRSKYGMEIPVASVWDYEPNESPPRDSVQNRCSELSFSPHSEGEAENVLEEKSISQIAMPAMRSPVKQLDFSEKHGSDENQKTISSATLNLSYKQDRPKSAVVNSHQAKVNNITSESVQHRNDISDNNTPSSIQAHSEQLKQQMAMWQQQLAENQKLLTSKNIDPEQLQENLKVQQQLMLQVQECMQALTLQQASQQGSDSNSTNSPLSSADNTPKSTPRDGYHSATNSLDSSRSSTGPEKISPRMDITKPPSPPPIITQKPLKTVKPPSKSRTPKNDPRFERKLDPREELMFAIRGFTKNGLKKVPVNEIRWQGSFVPQS